MDACRIGDIMAMDTKEWPKEVKIKVLLSAAIIVGAAIFFALI